MDELVRLPASAGASAEEAVEKTERFVQGVIDCLEPRLEAMKRLWDPVFANPGDLQRRSGLPTEH